MCKVEGHFAARKWLRGIGNYKDMKCWYETDTLCVTTLVERGQVIKLKGKRVGEGQHSLWNMLALQLDNFRTSCPQVACQASKVTAIGSLEFR